MISRNEAKQKGIKRYFTGEPCKRGHISERLVSSYSCCECAKDFKRMTMTSSESAYRRLKSNFNKSDLNKVLKYNKTTGDLTWRDGLFRMRGGDKVGVEVGRGQTKYYSVGICGRRYLVHRVIFFMLNGRWPDSIDHINGNGLDNSEKNLRAVSHKENMKNARLSIKSTTGHCGVSMDKRRNTYRAYITIDGRQFHLGHFKNIEDAIAAREFAGKKNEFHDLHGTDKERAIL